MWNRCPSVVALVVLLASTPARAVVDGDEAVGAGAVGVLPAKREASCTATLVAPRVVLTAAHCVRGPLGGVVFAAQFDGATVPRPFLDVRTAPAFDMTTLRDDVAVALLAEPAPETPLRMGTMTDSDVGMRLVVLGYGGDDRHAPRRTMGSARVTSRTTKRLELAGELGRACRGDSGGPVVRDGAIVGVVSSGDAACSGSFQATGIDDALRGFVETYIRETADRSASPGERCWDDRQCRAGGCVFPADARHRGVCSPAPSPSPGAIGAPCAMPWDCNDAICARATDDGPARCLAPCAGVDIACATGARCEAVRPVGGGAAAARACVDAAAAPHREPPRSPRYAVAAASAMIIAAMIFVTKRRHRGSRAE